MLDLHPVHTASLALRQSPHAFLFFSLVQPKESWTGTHGCWARTRVCTGREREGEARVKETQRDLYIQWNSLVLLEEKIVFLLAYWSLFRGRVELAFT